MSSIKHVNTDSVQRMISLDRVHFMLTKPKHLESYFDISEG